MPRFLWLGRCLSNDCFRLLEQLGTLQSDLPLIYAVINKDIQQQQQQQQKERKNTKDGEKTDVKYCIY